MCRRRASPGLPAAAHRWRRTCRSWQSLKQVEHRPVPADALVQDFAANVEVADAAEAHPKPASHLLFQRNLARNAEFARQALLDPQQAGGPAGEERVAAPLCDQPAEQLLDV